MASTREVLDQQLETVKKQVAELKAKSAPLRKKRDDLQAKFAPVEKEIQSLNQQIKEIEQPHLGELESALNILTRK